MEHDDPAEDWTVNEEVRLPVGVRQLNRYEEPLVPQIHFEQKKDSVSPETLKNLEKLLRVVEQDSELQIENGSEKLGTKPGDNYMSRVFRTNLTGIRGDKTPYEAAIITKCFPDDGRNMISLRTKDFFVNEAHVYNKIVPAMQLQCVAPKCYDAGATGLIMEDLCSQGYAMRDRTDLLDFDHCEATLKAHAFLHARSLVFKLRNPEEFKKLVNPLKELGFPQDGQPAVGETICKGVRIATESLMESVKNPEPEMSKAIEFLNSKKAEAFNLIRDLLVPRDEKYDVLIHGDSWNNNIFYKHDEHGKVVSVKFVDFQIVRHCSPAIDFHYFVYTSARSSVLEDRYDDLIKIYQSALVNELKNSDVSDEIIKDLSLEWFQQELRKTSVYGLFTGLWLINAIFAAEDDVPNVAATDASILAPRTENAYIMTSRKIERIKCIALHYYRTYLNV